MRPDDQRTSHDWLERDRAKPSDGGGAPLRWDALERAAALRPSAIAMTAATAALAATLAPAQAQFTSITGFGDSYADTGAAPGGAFQLGRHSLHLRPHLHASPAARPSSNRCRRSMACQR